MDKQAAEKKYIECGGIFCPRCDSGAIEDRTSKVYADKLSHTTVCNNCNAEWTELYTLTGINIFREGDTMDQSEKVELKVWCENQQQHDYMMRMLKEPLCRGCGREEAECSCDPCEAVMKDREEPEPASQIFSVTVTDTASYDVFVRASTSVKAADVLIDMSDGDWFDEKKNFFRDVTDRQYGKIKPVAERDLQPGIKILESKPEGNI